MNIIDNAFYSGSGITCIAYCGQNLRAECLYHECMDLLLLWIRRNDSGTPHPQGSPASFDIYPSFQILDKKESKEMLRQKG